MAPKPLPRSRAIVWDRGKLNLIYRGRNGPVAKKLQKDAIRVQNAAKLNATGRRVAGARNPEGRGPRVRKGRLRSSISWKFAEDAKGLYVVVYTNVVYGRYLEMGMIRTRRGFRSYPFLRPALAVLKGRR